MFKRASLMFVLLCTRTSLAQIPLAEDCSAPKTAAGLAVCVARELRESDARINTLYTSVRAHADAASREALRSQQRDWIRDRDADCHVATREQDRERWYAAVAADTRQAACVIEETRYRIAVLEAMNTGRPLPSRQEVRQQSSASTKMAITQPDAKGNPRLPTKHIDGKWYFEVTIDTEGASRLGAKAIMAGFQSADGDALVTMHQIRLSDRGTYTIGCAIDLDNGKLYFREGGSWNGKEPGSNLGMDVKLGREYGAQVRGIERIDHLLSAGVVMPNFGDTPFTYPLPESYRSWR